MKRLLLFIFLPCMLFSEIILVFPIQPDRKNTFNVHIPSSFNEAWRTPTGKMVEYIPENETLDTWTEIITIETLPQQPSMLEFYLRKHKIAIEMLFSSTELARHEVSFSEENGIKVGHAYYRNPHYQIESQTIDESHMECMGMKLVQGKSDLFRIAYNIKYPKGESHHLIEAKIQRFLDSCEIIASKLSP